MDACGVCIGGFEGAEEECTGYRCVIVSAGKDWRCCECGCLIPKKTKYELASWFYRGGGSGQSKTCLICSEIADAFSCGGRYHHDGLWDDMEAVYDKLTTGCFDKLKSPQAKAELQRRWREWKGFPR